MIEETEANNSVVVQLQDSSVGHSNDERTVSPKRVCRKARRLIESDEEVSAT
jgi:hypothetical protein